MNEKKQKTLVSGNLRGDELLISLDTLILQADVASVECKCGAKPVFSLIYFLDVQLSQYLGDENE